MRLSNKIVLASLNREKFVEFSQLLTSWPEIELLQASDLLRNPEGLGFVERYDTYLENSTAKARLANQGTHYPSLGDDSGLECVGLGGKPGVRSHRYATPKAGISQDEANTQLLLSELKGKAREARFVCTLVLVIEGISLHATGTLEGTIAESPRGKNGFGYDPVFVPKGQTKSFAEMTEIEKNAISHRTHALQDLMTQVKANGIVFAKP